MSTYPLAHDVHGNPIDVPPEVAFWRVRRQPSRQGRPSRVTGLDGAPLIVPVDAEANDLRAEGCGPDKYRLDGLDGHKQPVVPPIVAFTELVPTEADMVARTSGSANPAAYRMADALSRAVDALSKQEALVRSGPTEGQDAGPRRRRRPSRGRGSDDVEQVGSG